MTDKTGFARLNTARSKKFLSAVFDRFADCVLDRWVIALDKYARNKLLLDLHTQGFYWLDESSWNGRL